ncbi:hypothetical protein BaRGS_00018073, partial [Batillaria attramentaria]
LGRKGDNVKAEDNLLLVDNHVTVGLPRVLVMVGSDVELVPPCHSAEATLSRPSPPHRLPPCCLLSQPRFHNAGVPAGFNSLLIVEVWFQIGHSGLLEAQRVASRGFSPGSSRRVTSMHLFRARDLGTIIVRVSGYAADGGKWFLGAYRNTHVYTQVLLAYTQTPALISSELCCIERESSRASAVVFCWGPRAIGVQRSVADGRLMPESSIATRGGWVAARLTSIQDYAGLQQSTRRLAENRGPCVGFHVVLWVEGAPCTEIKLGQRYLVRQGVSQTRTRWRASFKKLTGEQRAESRALERKFITGSKLGRGGQFDLAVSMIDTVLQLCKTEEVT